MRCRSVACIWSDSPPVHCVTAVAVLNHPPTLYTGGSDGSIIWWNLPTSSLPNQEVKPVAMLCGHAAPIADMGICLPSGKSDDFGVSSSSNRNSSGALISACKDGMLCVWSRASGYCRRRRQLPPWAGSPSMVRPLPENRRYVCVACSSISDHQSADGEGRFSVDRDMHNRKSSKCTIVVIDSYTLSVVQTVFHGNLSIGPLKCMTIALSHGDMENMSIMLIDSLSSVQIFPISKDSDKTGTNAADMRRNSFQLEIKDWLDASGSRELLVGCACRGHVLVFIYATYCTFRLVDNGDKIGEIVFLDDQLCQGDSRIIGGLFLGDDAGMEQKFGALEYSFSVEFAVWNNKSSANIYRTSFLNVFKSELLFSIPALPLPPDVVLSTYFVNACNYLLSVNSVGFHVGKSVIWKPHIAAWSLPQQPNKENSMSKECKILSIGSFPDDWRLNTISGAAYIGSNIVLETDILHHVSNNGENPSGSEETYLCRPKDNSVSSSMVISESCYAPSAIVYGYYTGTIEVVRFDMYFEESGFHDGNSPETTSSTPSKLRLSGHTGAILCLAAHQMVGISEKWNFSHVLISGGMDCTVRIWDLDSGNPIIVMHQHVGPVRQILLPPPKTDRPWIDCFLSVAEDSCVALTSLETLKVERMFPGHPHYPTKVSWDSVRGYAACLCLHHLGSLDALDILYIWDVKTGARERVIRGSAARSMFDHFCTDVKNDSSLIRRNTSASSLTLPISEDQKNLASSLNNTVKGTSSQSNLASKNLTGSNTSQPTGSKGTAAELFVQSNKPIVEGSCPFPGIATLCFDLKSMISLCQSHGLFKHQSFDEKDTHSKARTTDTPKSYTPKMDAISQKTLIPEILSPRKVIQEENSDLNGIPSGTIADADWILLLETYLLQFGLSLLHLWNVDHELDELLVTEMKLKRPEIFNVASGLIGDRGSLTLSFPGSYATLELWKSSPEYCATRSLTMVSLAQHMLSLMHSCSASSSALAAFYTRNFTEKIPDVKPPLLQLLVSFWQDELEQVKMAARSLFHCAASRAIPRPLRNQKTNAQANYLNGVTEQDDNVMNKSVPNSLGFDGKPEKEADSQTEESEIISWLDSFEMQDWISCVGGTSQDAMTSHVIVAAALAVWYPSIVRASLPALVVQPLVKLVKSMNEKYSSTAAEILAEGMESTWKQYIASDLPHLIGDIFFQIECVSVQNSATSVHIKETLVGILLPSLAIADIPVFLSGIESQIWSTSSDSFVHVVSLLTLNKVVRGYPRKLVQYLDKVVAFILQTMDPSNTVMRRTCIKSAMSTLKELSRVFPMVTLNDTSTRLAFGDAISEIKSSCIRVYDMQSMSKIKVLDASGPPGFPSLIGGTSEMAVTTAISALCFSTDGEGIVAFSENGLMIRWWSLGSVWWEKISRNLTPVQCTKVIFVPPWEGFSPSCTRSSIMATALSDDVRFNLQDERRGSGEIDRLKLLIHNLDLSYRLEWVADRKVKLTQHGHELGVFQL